MPVLSLRSSICIATMAASLMLSGAVAASYAASAPSGQGESVSTSDLTADSTKNTFMIVGAPYTTNSTGAAIIFKRDSNGAWNQPTKLSPTKQVLAQFGRSVSMSLDGTVAVVGAPGDNVTVTGNNYNPGNGGFYYYRYVAGKWKMLVQGVGFAPGDAMGQSVYVTPDGSKFFVGAPGTSQRKGAVHAFKVLDNNFMYIGVIVPADDSRSNFGTSISSSKNGDYLIVGGNYSSSGMGAAWIFRPGSEGRYTGGTKIVGTGGLGTVQEQGKSVTMNWAGDTIAIGAPHENNYKGSVYVFARNQSGGWEQKAQLKDSAAVEYSSLGSTVAMAGDGGGTIVASEPYARSGDTGPEGKVMTFIKAEKSWKYTEKPSLSNSNCNGLGQSLAIANDASLLAAGAPSSVNAAQEYTGATCYFAKAKAKTSAWDIKGKPIIAK